MYEYDKLISLQKYTELINKNLKYVLENYFENNGVVDYENLKEYVADIDELLKLLIKEKEPCKSNIDNHTLILINDNFKYSQDPISISEVCYKLNDCIGDKIKKIHPKDLTIGLMNLGYLEIVNLGNEKVYKIPTEKGLLIGITTLEKRNTYGNTYSVNLYSMAAQRYIVLNLDKILHS